MSIVEANKDDNVLSLPEPQVRALDDIQSNLFDGSSKLISSLIYTVVYEYCNDLIEKGVNVKVAVQTAQNVCNKWLNDPIKIRKRPVTREKQPKPENQQQQSRPKSRVDAKTAIKRLHYKSEISWTIHPVDSRLMYSTELKLQNGYAVKNPEDKIVAIITDDDTIPLFHDDIKAAINAGYNVDASYFDLLRRGELN